MYIKILPPSNESNFWDICLHCGMVKADSDNHACVQTYTFSSIAGTFQMTSNVGHILTPKSFKYTKKPSFYYWAKNDIFILQLQMWASLALSLDFSRIQYICSLMHCVLVLTLACFQIEQGSLSRVTKNTGNFILWLCFILCF